MFTTSFDKIRKGMRTMKRYLKEKDEIVVLMQIVDPIGHPSQPRIRLEDESKLIN